MINQELRNALQKRKNVGMNKQILTIILNVLLMNIVQLGIMMMMESRLHSMVAFSRRVVMIIRSYGIVFLLLNSLVHPLMKEIQKKSKIQKII